MTGATNGFRRLEAQRRLSVLRGSLQAGRARQSIVRAARVAALKGRPEQGTAAARDDSPRIGQRVEAPVGPFADLAGALGRYGGAGRVRISAGILWAGARTRLLQPLGGSQRSSDERAGSRMASM